MIEEKIKQYSVKIISEKTGISEPTIYRYMKNENLEGHIKFIKLLKYLEIDIDSFIEKTKNHEKKRRK